mmetsp:Transcript_23450/g.41244  ORF Transcript_23450/g.41244 Transcript_23450/m.41244 type:complete len:276 (+) Transcript_23450:628-1455(+)
MDSNHCRHPFRHTEKPHPYITNHWLCTRVSLSPHRTPLTGPRIEISIPALGEQHAACSDLVWQVLYGRLEVAELVHHCLCESEAPKLHAWTDRGEGAQHEATWRSRILRAWLPGGPLEVQRVVVDCGPLLVEVVLHFLVLWLVSLWNLAGLCGLNPFKHLDCTLQLQAILDNGILKLRILHWDNTSRLPLDVHKSANGVGVDFVRIRDADALLEAPCQKRPAFGTATLIEPMNQHAKREQEQTKHKSTTMLPDNFAEGLRITTNSSAVTANSSRY